MMNLQDAKVYAEELSLDGYSDWRLPDMKELSMLCDRRYSNPAIDINYFPSITPGKYWTKSGLDGRGEKYWFVNLSIGRTSYEDPSSKFYVLCVRDIK